MALGLLATGSRALAGQMVKSTGKKVVASKVFNRKSKKKTQNNSGEESPSQSSSSIVYQPNRINVNNFSVDSESPTSNQTTKTVGADSQIRIIRSQVINIEKILKNNLKKDKKYADKKRRITETDKRDTRENVRENLNAGPKGLALAKKLVPGNIMSAITNFIGNVLLGKFLIFLLNNYDKLLEFIKFIAPVTDFLGNVTGVIFNGIVSLIEGAYDINEAIRKEIEGVGGEGALEEYDKFTDAFKKFANIAIILALVGVPGFAGGKGGPKGPFTKPGPGAGAGFKGGGTGGGGASAIRSYTSRSAGAKLMEKKYGNSAAKLYEQAVKNGKSPAAAKAIVDKAIKSGKITPQAAGPGLKGGSGAAKGGVFRRGAGKAISRGTTKIMGRGARLGVSRAGTKLASKISKFGGGRIPILGPLVTGIFSLMNGEPVGQALFKAGGAGLGGFLGTFIPIPFLGTIVGTILGEYVGDLFYQVLTKGIIGGMGKKLSNTFQKVIDTGTLIKDWFFKGLDNIRHQDGGALGDFKITIPFLGSFQLGGWAEFLNPIGNPLKKIKIIKDSFFSESEPTKKRRMDYESFLGNEDAKSKLQRKGDQSGSGSGTQLKPGDPQTAQIEDNEMDLFQRLVLAEAGGEGTLGMALVARSVMNRTGLIQSGKANTGTFLANDDTITGVIMGKNQYQPISDGSIDGPFTDAQKQNALKAIELAKDPEKLRAALIEDGVDPSAVKTMLASTGFRTGSAFNDPSQNVNVTKYKNHFFNTAGNTTGEPQAAKIEFSGTDDSGAYATGLKTAPKGYMGSGTEYHIDTKINKSLDMKQKVALVDQLARGYASRGRQMEFSNDAVSGEVYNPNASYQDKVKLLNRVFGAHSHSVHSEFDSLDYYIPQVSDAKGRFGKSAEAAEILSPTLGGSKLEYREGGGYGAFVVQVDADGNVLSKTGHGDIRTSKAGTVVSLNKPEKKPEQNFASMWYPEQQESPQQESPSMVVSADEDMGDHYGLDLDIKPSKTEMASQQIKSIGQNQGTGAQIKVPNVGTFVSGRNLFGQGTDKYFDTSGNSISYEDFYSKLNSSKSQPKIAKSISNKSKNIEESASYESNDADVVVMMQPIILPNVNDGDDMFSGLSIPKSYG